MTFNLVFLHIPCFVSHPLPIEGHCHIFIVLPGNHLYRLHSCSLTAKLANLDIGARLNLFHACRIVAVACIIWGSWLSLLMSFGKTRWTTFIMMDLASFFIPIHMTLNWGLKRLFSLTCCTKCTTTIPHWKYDSPFTIRYLLNATVTRRHPSHRHEIGPWGAVFDVYCTRRSNWIEHRKWKYSIVCLRDVTLEMESDLSNSI